MKVKIIKRARRAVLVEYRDEKGNLNRTYVPPSKVETSEDRSFVADDILASGVSYGIPWAQEILGFTLNAEAIEQALHESGVWVSEDVTHQKIVGAIATALAGEIATIIKAARREARGKNG